MLSLSRQVLTQAMHIRVPIQNFSFESTARSAQEDSVVPIGCCPTKQISIMRIRWDLAALKTAAPDFPSHSAHYCVDAQIFVCQIRSGFRGDAWEASEWLTYPIVSPRGNHLMYLGFAPAAKTFPDLSAFCLGACWLVHGRWSC